MKGGLFIAVLLISLFSFSMVSATVEDTINAVAEGAAPIARLVLGDVTSVVGFDAGEVLFAKVLVFILVLTLVHVGLRQVPVKFSENNGIVFLISAIVAILGTRFLTNGQLISFIWLPYGVLAVSLSALLPFIIGFFFLQGFRSSLIRRVGWATFAVVFLGLALARWYDFASDAIGFNLAWMYVAIAALSLLGYFFDRRIYAAVAAGAINRISNDAIQIKAVEIQKQIEELQDKLTTQSATEEQRRVIRERIKGRQKALRELLSSG